MFLLSCDDRVHTLLARCGLRILCAAIKVLQHYLHGLLLLLVQNKRQGLILWDVWAKPSGGSGLFLLCGRGLSGSPTPRGDLLTEDPGISRTV